MGNIGDINPLSKVPFNRAISRVHRGLLSGVSLILPRNWTGYAAYSCFKASSTRSQACNTVLQINLNPTLALNPTLY